MIGVQYIVDIILHGLGVEGCAIVENYIRAQYEGIRETIRRDGPAISQAGDESAIHRIFENQRIVDRPERDRELGESVRPYVSRRVEDDPSPQAASMSRGSASAADKKSSAVALRALPENEG